MESLNTTYTVTGKKQGQITFKFDLNGNLIEFKYEGEPLDEAKAKWLYARVPVHESKMNIWHKIKQFTITKGAPDTSFDNFWNTYQNKVKRTRAEDLWKKLSDIDKFNAIAGIRRYDNWLRQQKGIAKMLPDTYIYQKRWLDDF